MACSELCGKTAISSNSRTRHSRNNRLAKVRGLAASGHKMRRVDMPNIRAIDMLFLEDLLAMGGGYVLNFSDRTFSQFFAEELNCDIDDPAYAVNGRSKGKRLRCFLQTVDIPTVVRTLKALWECREAVRARDQQPDTVENAEGRLLALINRLEGKPETAKPTG